MEQKRYFETWDVIIQEEQWKKSTWEEKSLEVPEKEIEMLKERWKEDRVKLEKSR